MEQPKDELYDFQCYYVFHPWRNIHDNHWASTLRAFRLGCRGGARKSRGGEWVAFKLRTTPGTEKYAEASVISLVILFGQPLELDSVVEMARKLVDGRYPTPQRDPPYSLFFY
jgi:hypothetical protein